MILAINLFFSTILFLSEFCDGKANLQAVTERALFKHLLRSEIRDCSSEIISSFPKKSRRTKLYTSDSEEFTEYSFKSSEIPMQGRVPSLVSRITSTRIKDPYPLENFCVVEVSNWKELRTSLDLLYNDVFYDKCVINIFFHTNGTENLQRVVDEVWFKGYSMNIRFISYLKHLNRILVLGAAPYSPSTCKKGKLIEV